MKWWQLKKRNADLERELCSDLEVEEEEQRERGQDVDTWPAEYFPINQTQDHDFSLAIRSRQDAGALLPILVSTLHQIEPRLGLCDESTMNGKIDSTQASLLHRFSAWLVGGFAAMALMLGAQRKSVYRLVIGKAGWLTAAGLAIGLLCSLGTSMLIRNLLFGVQAWDAATLGGVALLLAVASLAAAFVPARRAATVDPMQTLRTE